MTKEELIGLGFTKVNYLGDEEDDIENDVHFYSIEFGDVILQSTFNHVSLGNNWGVYLGGCYLGENGKLFYTEDFNILSSLMTSLSGFSLIDYEEPELPEINYFMGELPSDVYLENENSNDEEKTIDGFKFLK
jgi:hypothetical protein